MLQITTQLVSQMIILSLLFLGIQPVSAGGRIALVIGNSRYQAVAPLVTPEADARGVAKELVKFGFKLVGGSVQLNLNKTQLEQSIHDLGSQMRGMDVALLYYSGHGIQVGDVNYLIPINASVSQINDVKNELVSTNLVLTEMNSAKTRLNVVILDACRNNPFGAKGTRSLKNLGLAQMQTPPNTIIAFAAQPGQTSIDDTANGNSPYAQALIAALRQPNLELLSLFNEVGTAVKQHTKGIQQPWVLASSTAGKFVLHTTESSDNSNANTTTKVSFNEAQPQAKSAWLQIDPKISATSINPQRLAGRSYYLLDSNSTCNANSPSRTKIKSWRVHLEFAANGQVKVWGKLCNDQAHWISWSEAKGRLKVNPDLTQVSYDGQILTYFPAPPKLCPNGIWCPVDAGQ